MYTLTDYKNDGKLSFDLLKKYNEHPDKEVSIELENVQLRMEKFAAKKFIGKYLKYNEYVFNIKGKLVDTITHLLYPCDTVQITIKNKKYKFLSHKNDITPYCNYGVTVGRYYIKTPEAFSIGGDYYEEITKDEWNAAKAKLVHQNKANEINAALQILGNVAISYVHKNPSKEQKKAESIQDKLLKKYSKASQTYTNICNKRIEEMKTKITSNDFDAVLKNVQKDGYFGVCDNDLSYIFKPKTNKKKK